MAPQIDDTLILSDLHLGADMSRAREALRVLRENQYRRLILLGDIFADLNFGRLKKEHWKFLGFIRKLSNPKRKVEVVWVEGNHDHGLTEIMSHLVGVRVYQEYQWEYQGLRHIAVHGHQFDGFVVSNVRVSYLIGTLLYFLLFNLGLIVLIAPVSIDPSIVRLDWPFLVGLTWLATFFLARGTIGRPEGAILVGAYALYAGLHVI